MSISAGTAMGPMTVLACFFISSMIVGDLWYATRRITKALMISPLSESGFPVTAASATARKLTRVL
jgi:hypothetical protein